MLRGIRLPRLGGLLRSILAARGSIQAPLYGKWRREIDIIRSTRRRVPLLMDDAAALHLLICVRAAAGLGGMMAEVGVFKGGSARLICEAKGAAPLHLFDLFEGVDAFGRGDELHRRFHHVHGTLGDVERLLCGYDAITFHPGLFPVSIPDTLAAARFSFVHIDLDLVDAIASALEFFHPRMVAGGIMLGDDFTDPDVRATFAAFFKARTDTMIELPWGQVMVVRNGEAPPR